MTGRLLLVLVLLASACGIKGEPVSPGRPAPMPSASEDGPDSE